MNLGGTIKNGSRTEAEIKEYKRKAAEEEANRKVFVEAIMPTYNSICKQIGSCVHSYTKGKTFRPNLLLGEYEFLQSNNMSIVFNNYKEHIDFVREQEYYINRQAEQKAQKDRRTDPNAFGVNWASASMANQSQSVDVYYAPWSFKDRWAKVFRRLDEMEFLEKTQESICGSYIQFFTFKKDKVKALQREAFINFI